MTRRELQDDLLARWAEDGFGMVLVSHALESVAYLADRIVVLTDKPTRVAADVVVDLPRPRARDTAGRVALMEVVDGLAGAMAG